MIHYSRSIEFETLVTALSVSDDGSLAAVATGKAIELVDLESGARLLRIATEVAPTGLSLSSDNTLLAVATGEPTVRLYDCGSGALSQELKRDTVMDFLRKQSQLQVAFFPMTKTLATRGGGSDITIWNCESGEWDHLVRNSQRNGFMVMHPDGTHLAVLGEPSPNEYRGQVLMFRVHQGLQSAWNAPHDNEQRVTSAAFSPHGAHLATHAGDAIRVWESESGALLKQWRDENGGNISSIAFAANEHHLLLLRPRAIQLWRINRGIAIAEATSRRSADFQGFGTSRDGRVLVTFGAYDAIDVWKVSPPTNDQP